MVGSGDTNALAGGGAMGALMRAKDWSQTPLGPVEAWSQSLRTSVSTCLNCAFPILLWWGADLVMLYNDDYRSVIGDKHPRALGRPGRECWPEIWSIIGPMLEGVLTSGQATRAEDLLLLLERSGYTEECYFSFSYSPIRDETGGVGGIFTPVKETTEKIIGERRLRTLRDLAARTRDAREVDVACRLAAEVLSANHSDLPFALLYRVSADGKTARLCSCAGIEPGVAASPNEIDLRDGAVISPWALAKVVASGRAERVDDLPGVFGALPGGAWPIPPTSALSLPVALAGQERPAAVLVAALSPRKALDADYRSFLDLVAGQIAAAIAAALAYDEERRRAEALAAIDRAKTAFFSNVSHEFRTPLTLMLGPLEAARARSLPDDLGRDIAMAHRNGLRLLKLVNSLLDFSRIEAGRVRAAYRPTDLAALTAELASVFRATTDRAGLALDVDCPPLGQPVHVDREMWEKIVLNLVSNALKYTLAGGITVTLRRAGGRAVLSVCDTGIGIPAPELPRLFDRFHRVEGAQGRTNEGTGIGLALVHELARMHGGTVGAQSVLGKGSCFTVAVPFGTAHLPSEQIRAAATALGADSYVEEALRWLPDDGGTARPDFGAERAPRPEQPSPEGKEEDGARRATILLADDNADMRDYLRRLLAPRYEVRAVADGEAALAALRAGRPDLVLSDVMMPRLHGFGLVQAIRADAALADIPVILLSARAGEEASIEGLEAGADDYLVKPFSARELLARVRANLELARLRREAERALRQARAQLQAIVDDAPVGICLLDAGLRIQHVNPKVRPVFGDIPDLIGRPVGDVLQVLWGAETAGRILLQFRRTLATGEAYRVPEFSAQRHDRRRRESYDWQTHRIALADGQLGIICYFTDISLHVRARQALAASEERFRLMADAMPQKIFTATPDGAIDYFNRQWLEFAGLSFDELRDWGWTRIVSPDDREEALRAWRRCVATGAPFEQTHRFRRADGAERWHLSRARAVREGDGTVTMWIGSNTDIHEQKEIEEARRALNDTLERQVAERTRALEVEVAERQLVEAALQQAQRLEALGQLTGGVAHDFNNLLTVVIGHTEGIVRAAEGNARVVRMAAAAGRAAERGARLTGQLLAFARRQHLRPEIVAVHRLIAQSSDLVRQAVGETVTIAVDAASELWPTLIDPAQFDSVILNLAINARDAMPDGGRLTIAARNAALDEASARQLDLSPGDYVVVSVADTGCGMPREVQGRCFEPFFTTKEIGRGTGLGLSQTYGFARQSGGTATVDSAVGRGTTIALYLPRAQPVAAEAASAPSLPPVSGQGTVLLVDDQLEVGSVLDVLLTELGYRVLVAADGVEARGLLESGQEIDLLLTDVVMPNGVSGIELAHAAQRLRRNLGIILVSGYSPDDHGAVGALPETWFFLEKPLRQNELAATVAAALGRGAPHR